MNPFFAALIAVVYLGLVFVFFGVRGNEGR
jgi:hypothetical protein